MSDEARQRLLETLREAQRFGFFGSAPIEQAIAHAAGFVEGLGDTAPGARIADIGSGGGLPGLVIAARLPGCAITLIDRRQKRTDFLERAVSRLEFQHVVVVCADVADVAAEVEGGIQPGFDAITARGFGPPRVTLELASRLLVGSGPIVISEPPTGDRWIPELLEKLALTSTPVGNVRRFMRY